MKSVNNFASNYQNTSGLPLGLASLLLWVVFVPVFSGVVLAQKTVDFQSEVRPILANHCFACHGFDEEGRQGDLRLDVESDPLDLTRSPRTIVPGQADASELVRRILSGNPDLVMPPTSTNKPLSDAQKEVLKRWIDQGARYEKHWAFAPLVRKPLPTGTAITQADHNPIDHWVQSELARRNLTASPPADTATLVRRLYLDLLGTVPSPEELQAIQSDGSPNKIDRLIEVLLASPQFGERWGRHWMDQARYADSNGFTIDGARTMWPYRDWIIAAINADMPFDQFSIEQLAGDLLGDGSGEQELAKNQLIASAFHRNTMINEEGGVKADQYRHEAIVDRVNTTGAVWLGLTVGCAQCHTHKYDPISIDDYYRLYAFFNACADNNSASPTIEVLEGEVFGLPESIRDDMAELRKLNQELSSLEAQIKKQQQLVPPELDWNEVSLVHASAVDSGTNVQLLKLEDGSVLVPPEVTGNASYDLEFRLPNSSQPLTAIRLRTLTHESLPQSGPGKASNGNFVLSEFQVFLQQSKLPFAAAWSDHSQPKYPVEHAIDSDPKTGWAINTDASQVKAKPDLKMNAPHAAVFAFATPVSATDMPIHVHLLHDINKDYLIGRFAIDVSSSPIPKQEPIPTEQIEQLKSRIADLKSRLPNEGKPVSQMVYKEQPNPPDTYRLLRGDFLSPDKQNGPLSPSIPTIFSDGQISSMRNRLDLARWLVSKENPLTPRVMVNRVWMRLFGIGLVETENDFGLQGSPPSHPELLDWLAADWIDSGWSLKHLVYRIVSSSTYQQSSDWRADLAEVDAANRLLGRQARIRLDAEVIRDRALSASGVLSKRIGGPSVHPPQPAGIYNFTQNSKAWKEDTGANRYRKTMYTEFYRSAPYPLFTTFDSPDFSTVCTRRSRTNTPLQALAIANDPVFWELCVHLADRALRESARVDSKGESITENVDFREIIRHMAALAWSRQPTEAQIERLCGFHESTVKYYRQNPKELEDLGGLDSRRAAYAHVARVLFNTDEFVNRD